MLYYKTAIISFQRLIFLLPALFACTVVQSQNIVPNGNLEDINICTELNAPCSPSAWFTVKKYVPGGYYHQYPDHAASGTQYFELNVASNGTTRQYWQTRLLCKLVPGKKYQARVKVAAGEVGPNLHDIGFYFTNQFIYAANDTLLQPSVYLDFLDAKISKLKHNWFQLKKEFTANAGAGFLVVGNFSAEDNRSILKKRNNGYLISLMIDDIDIHPEQGMDCATYQQTKDSLYAIRKRHSGDTLLTAVIPVDTASKRKLADSLVPAQAKKIDTLQLNNVLFAFDRYVLIHPDTLEAFRVVLSNPAIKKIVVAGYTDDAGSVAYNALLSEKRAHEIMKQLTERFPIPVVIIRAEGRGISKQYADNSLNRRVDIYVYYQE